MKARGVHVRNTINIGDLVCCPLDYFPELDNGERCDVREMGESEGWTVIGGGGLLHPELVGNIEKLADVPARHRTIIWGIGDNQHGASLISHPQWLDRFAKRGIRDIQSEYWTPCASCMHPAFDLHINDEPDEAFAVYQHFEHAIEHPSFNRTCNAIYNFGPQYSTADTVKHSMEATVRFLASGETVLTNSYHGAYWAMLLGRKVELYKPFSNRFYGLPTPTSNFLSWCRDACRDFADEVKELVA